MEAGVPNVIKTATNIGVESRLEPYPSVSLGSFEVTPLEIAYAYSVFANLGVKAEPVSILAVATRDGHLLESRDVKMKRVAPASVTYVMNDMLKDVFEYGTAARTRSLGFDRPFAGKTGTTSNYRDAWFIGYSPRILSLVWIGYDDGHNLRLGGGEACVPIWTSHMKRIASLVPDVDWKEPDDVVDRAIDPESGLLATPWCPVARREVFVTGTEPGSICPVHAGYGGPSPFWRESGIPESDEPPSPSVEDPLQQQHERERREREREREKGIRRLLKIIFGDGR
jgi:penicillin-binding protein 1B